MKPSKAVAISLMSEPLLRAPIQLPNQKNLLNQYSLMSLVADLYYKLG